MDMKLEDQYKFSKLQMAAEAFLLERGQPVSDAALIRALEIGNRHSSRFTTEEAENFAKHWKVLDQSGDYRTGFSGTLFECVLDDPATGARLGERVVSFRSTEFIDDAVRDNVATNELEIKETGWAWGQLRDMEDWYNGLRKDPDLLMGKDFSVTGYSLGGHLATAFNLMHGEDAHVKKVVTFNGAGIGQVESWNPAMQVHEFTKMTADDGKARIAEKFTDPVALEMYQAVSAGMAAGWTTDQARSYLISRLEQIDEYSPTSRDVMNAKRRLDDAIDNIEKLNDEIDRLLELKSGGPVESEPAKVAAKDIEALSLDYQLAVSFVAESSSAATLFGGLWRAYFGKEYVSPVLDNQFDLQGHSGPSAVANSQWHAGLDIPVYIEDQPLYRGGIGTAVLSQLIKYGVKLLHNEYSIRDFGDTHSLVLIQDSLAVQNLLVNLLPEAARDAKALATLTQIFEGASNLRMENGSLFVGDDQGKAIGDVFENVLNAFSDMLGLTPLGTIGGLAKHLEGNPNGNTWHRVEDEGGYTGRASFYSVINQILDSATYSGLLDGTVTLSVMPSTSSQARGEFGNLLSLLYLSPFALTGTGVSAILGAGQQALYNMWTSDAALSSEQILNGAGHFTDVYLDARAEFGQRITYYNTINGRYDVGVDGGAGEPHTTRYSDTSGVYKDLATGLTIDRGGVPEHARYIVFGTELDDTSMHGGDQRDRLFGNAGNDTISGGGGADHLEGNAGNDVLDGGAGDDSLYGGADIDHLSGGADRDALMAGGGDDRLDGGSGDDRLLGDKGHDIYLFSGAFGHDVIIDADGAGVVEVDGQLLTGGERAGTGRWETSVAGVRYTYVLATNGSGGTDLIIKQAGGQNSINIQSWSNGELGILLEGAGGSFRTNDSVGNLIEGSIRKRVDANGNYVTDANYNYVSDGIDPDAFDLLRGSSGVDTIRGYGGNDMLDGLGGDDTLEGGDGDDLITGGIGRDTLIGGAGKDFLFGSAAGVQTNGGRPSVDLNPTLPGVEVARGFSWLASRQVVSINGEEHSMMHFAGNDLTEVMNDGASTIDGGAGDDYINAGSGDDLARGGDDHDIVTGGGGADVLFGDNGDDELQGDGSTSGSVAIERHGADILDGGAGNDRMWGQGRDDQLYGGAGDDFLWGDSDKASEVPFAHHGNDYLDGGDGADQLVGNGGGDQLFGGAGKDRLFGDTGPEEMDGEFHGRDLLDGGADDDFLVGGGEDDRLRGGDGGDVLWGDSMTAWSGAQADGEDDLDGGAGDDFLYGGGKGDHLVGGAGNDQLVGDASSDIVAGENHGNDTLDGGDGDDIVFGMGGDDILFGGSGDDDVEGDDATLEGRFHGEDELHGGDGKDKLFGGGGNDVLLGDQGDDYLHGDYDSLDLVYHGDDQLDGGAGDDTLIGGGGDDILHGGDGIDTLVGEDGDDTLYGEAGNDYLVGGAGDDHLYGGEGNDVLDGGSGNNTLVGGAGDDTYIFNNGSPGTGSRADTAAVPNLLGINDNQGRNTVTFAVGVRNATIEVLADTTPSGDLVVKYGDSVVRFKDGLLQSTSGLAIGVEGAAQLSREELLARAPALRIAGSAGDDDIVGGTKADVIEAGEGDDIVRGGAGFDTLAGGAGDDVLGGQLGDDTLSGGLGNDTYMFSRFDGQDIIDNTATDGAETIDQLLLDTAIKVSDVSLSRSDNGDLVVTIGLDSVTIANHFGADGKQAIDRIVFGDGTIWDRNDLAFHSVVPHGGPGDDTLNGKPGADIMYGFDGNDRLFGAGGDDMLYGGNGSDTLDGGAGNDTLDGGAGNDTLKGGVGSDIYVFERGGGTDRINESGGANDVDVLRFGADISASDIVLSRNESTGLRFDLRGSNDKVYLEFQFYTPEGSSKIEEVRFADGTVWNASMLQTLVLAHSMTESDDQIDGFDTDDEIDGKAGNDRILGYTGSDRLSGGSGDDVLDGGAGTDLLDGGTGKDQLMGGVGADVYLFGRGSGADVLTESGVAGAEIDTIRLGVGIGAEHLELLQTGNDLVLSLDGGGEQLRIKSWFVSTVNGKSSDYRIERIEFADGVLWDKAAIDAKIVASGAADTQTGTSGDDVFVVDNADDVIKDAGAGIDTVLSSVSFGMGRDIENLTLTGVLHIDAWSNSLDNTITGNSGNNVITSDGVSTDTLIGRAGDDTYKLYDGAGKVKEAAGEGSDTVILYRFAGSRYELAENVENLEFNSNYIYPTNVYGNASDNTIWTDETNLNDIYDGGAGVDTIISRSGGGLFYVDNPLDRIVFAKGWGGGYIFASGDYKIDDNFRDLTMVGRNASRGEGNDFANVLNGSSELDPFGTKRYPGSSDNFAANVLAGRKGDDIYVLGFNDTIDERTGEGNDTAYLNWHSADHQAKASLTDYANVENFDVGLSSSAWQLDGNELTNGLYGNQADNVLNGGAGDDTLVGRGGNDTLDGGAGADLMQGDGGDDIYIVDDTDDRVVDSSGHDTVRSSISYVLDDGIERLAAIGDQATTLTGNGLDNTIDAQANGAANLLIGGAGDDIYLIGAGSGHDIIDNRAADGSTAFDTVRISDRIAIDELIIQRVGDDLIIRRDDSYSLTVQRYFGAEVEHRIDRFEVGGVELTHAWIMINTSPVLSGTEGADTLHGSADADRIEGLGGDDTLFGNAGDDRVNGGAGDDALHGGEGIDLLNGEIGDDFLEGDAGDDQLMGGEGNDTLDGGLGSDDMIGGAGNDIYFVDDEGDYLSELEGEGVDTIHTAIDMVLDSNVENVVLQHGGLDVRGNNLDNTFTGSNGDDEIYDISGGADTYAFGRHFGHDMIFDNGAIANTIVLHGYTAAEILVTTDQFSLFLQTADGANRITLESWSSYHNMRVVFDDGTVWDDARLLDLIAPASGTPYDDQIYGSDRDDVIDGLGGDDSLRGFGGNDVLNGGDGNDELDGGEGDDKLTGGAGNDLYVLSYGSGRDVILDSARNGDVETIYVDDAPEVVTLLRENNDLVVVIDSPLRIDSMRVTNYFSSGISLLVEFSDSTVWDNEAISANLPRTITGTGGADTLNGSENVDILNGLAGNDTLNGYGGNDQLDGGAGADRLNGGAGDDRYYVDNTGDVVTELANAGIDEVRSLVTYTLTANVETLYLVGAGAINGTGNALNNFIVGNAMDNILNGGAGEDEMEGGAGNDTYIVDNKLDNVFENEGEGIDLVQSSVNYTLDWNVENLTLTGTSAISGYGTSDNNTLIGNGANNRLEGYEGDDWLDGGAGRDTLMGGEGDDTYVVDNSGDVVTEYAGEGTDTVRSSLTTVLGNNLEALVLTGSAAVNGNGNAADNLLIGNAANNTLAGAGGDDILQGGAGIDTLNDTSGKNLLDGGAGADVLTGGTSAELFIGGKGNDTITTSTGADLLLFNRGDGADVLVSSRDTDNVISLGGGIAYTDLRLGKSGNDLVFSVGAGDQLTLKDWYANSVNRSVGILQMVIENTPTYDPDAAAVIYQKKVQWFDFDDLVAAFDIARGANANMANWSLTETLLTAEYAGGSDEGAYGGDLAWLYATAGTLSGVDMQSAHAVISDANFGMDIQDLQQATWQEGVPVLI